MKYTLQKTISGKIRIKYTCPHCQEALESALPEAGSNDTCPGCGKSFVVPGEEKRKEVEALLRQQMEAKKQAEAEKAAKLAEESEAAQLRKAHQLATQQQQAFELHSERKRIEQLEREAAEAEARTQIVTPSNTAYPAIELYVNLLRAIGWCLIVVACLVLVGYGIAFIAIVVNADKFEVGLIITGAIACVIAQASILGPALIAFVTSELLRLALDARRDLAKLVAQRQSVG